MKLQIKNFKFHLDLNEKINVLIIENKKEYREVVDSFVNKLDIKDGKILLFDRNELIVPSKFLFTFNDYYSFDINKLCLTKMYKKIKEISLLEYSDESFKIKSEIENFIYKIISQYDLYLEIDSEMDILDLLKSVKLKIKNYENLDLDRIINYMNIINELFGIKNFIFINFKQNFSEKEIIDFYEYVIYNDFNIVLVESITISKLQKESIFIIDDDLCEIY